MTWSPWHDIPLQYSVEKIFVSSGAILFIHYGTAYIRLQTQTI